MNCSYCDTRAVFFAQHFGKYFCKKHLSAYLLKKLRRNIRGQFLPKDTVSFTDDDSPSAWAARDLFGKAIENWPVSVSKSGKKKVSTNTLECETNAIIMSLATGTLTDEGTIVTPFKNFGTKELFTLGWLSGHRKECKKFSITGPMGTASKLNLIKIWERIQEFSQPQQNKKSKATGPKQ